MVETNGERAQDKQICEKKMRTDGSTATAETRVAVMSIIVENNESVEAINGLLHENGRYIIGRMGIPYREKKVSIISIVLDAPQDTISALSGKIGKLNGVSVKTAFSSVRSGPVNENE